MPTKKKKKSTRHKEVTYVISLPEYEKDMSHLMTPENRAYDEEAFFDKEIKKEERKKAAKKTAKKSASNARRRPGILAPR
jgi:hypothetical protein